MFCLCFSKWWSPSDSFLFLGSQAISLLHAAKMMLKSSHSGGSSAALQCAPSHGQSADLPRVRAVICTSKSMVPAGQHSQPTKAVSNRSSAAHGSVEGGLEDDSYDLCVICLEVAPEKVFLPCQHAVACAECATKVMKRSAECPMCRCKLHSVMSVHKV